MRYKNVMTLNNSISVRFEPEVKARLQTIAENSKANLNVADLVRLAVDEMLQNYETSGNLPSMLREDPTPYRVKKPR